MRGYEENKSLLQEKIKHMQVQIQNRESEIQRLHTKIGSNKHNIRLFLSIDLKKWEMSMWRRYQRIMS